MRLASTLVALLVGFAASTPAQAWVVRLSGPCSAAPGATVSYEVQALGFGADLAAFQGSIDYDPASLQLVDVKSPVSGPFSGGRLVSREPHGGRVSLASLDCNGGSSPSGSPAVAVVRFNVLSPAGRSVSLSLAEAKVLDPAGSPTTFSTEGAQLLIETSLDKDCDGVVDSADNCPAVYNPDQKDSYHDGKGGDACRPLLITLVEFSARWRGPMTVKIAWATASELDTVGFNLYRATSPTGPWTKVNTGLIPAEGSDIEGASYKFTDPVPSRGRYFYRLEDMDTSGTASSHGPVEVRGGFRVDTPNGGRGSGRRGGKP